MEAKGLTLSALIYCWRRLVPIPAADYYNGMTIVFGGLVSFLMSPLGFQCIHTIERILDRRGKILNSYCPGGILLTFFASTGAGTNSIWLLYEPDVPKLKEVR